ncbi:peptidoglycan-binding domain-containing protein [Agrobacterium sp.]|jgi:peptidoglycan hydrolase-like protein with peptidoglycan-binding domain|uniref:peptidoglycan-binding domain-containing protein n=1 Tax=Agrobacterium sp. TaxID=361 RepID=UPI0028AD96A6|nr:peptidoglycan-binding domain-containing protein [Agrobacterium sp.]
MAPRKRKSPEKKPVRREPGIVSLAVGAMGRQVGYQLGQHPRLIAGVAVFTIVFGFVSANALWYQPGVHPSPFLRTRDEVNPNGIAGYRVAQPLDATGDVTTFRIERAPGEATDQPVGDQPQQAAAPVSDGQPSQIPSQVVAEIQQELSRRGLYDGKADGKVGPRTTAAILFFEETVGMEQTGEPTTRVLAALKIDGSTVSAIPRDRPSDNAGNQGVAIDPVAAAIRKSENVKASPAAAQAQNAAVKPVNNELVAKIQQGLVNIAYANVTVDGMLGQQTRTAIRHFEKHYRLPETGEPSDAVLKKLKDIGAL